MYSTVVSPLHIEFAVGKGNEQGLGKARECTPGRGKNTLPDSWTERVTAATREIGDSELSVMANTVAFARDRQIRAIAGFGSGAMLIEISTSPFDSPRSGLLLIHAAEPIDHDHPLARLQQRVAKIVATGNIRRTPMM